MRALSAHTASVIAALEPVYGILLALVLLREVPAMRTVAGAIMIVGAATVRITGGHKHSERARVGSASLIL